MSYLDTYESPLTYKQAAHLLRRVTFGPNPNEINKFIGLTATEAVKRLIDNADVTKTLPQPVVMDSNNSNAGQSFLDKPFNYNQRFDYSYYLKYWWIGLMASYNTEPSIIEKLTAFWQNHFVTTHKVVEDYRFMHRYLMLLRTNCLGSFRKMIIEVTKDPAMLVYQNGDENEKDHPNENYGRELQELFVIGQRNYLSEPNYAESDVKEAARILTGWQSVNRYVDNSTSFGSVFKPERHDTADKQFSHYYNNKIIKGRSGLNAGDEELSELTDMLLAHPESARFICRKLYRWYVNTNVTSDVEDQVIRPLAAFFSSSQNDFAIGPVLKKLLSSNIFFDSANIGALVKSPAEFTIGTLRLFEQVVPDPVSSYVAFKSYTQPIYWRMVDMQLNFLDQPLVFGSLPYYQVGYSLNWINSSTLGFRRQFTDSLMNTWEYHPGYYVGIDFWKWIKRVQPNFTDVAGTPAISCEVVVDELAKSMFPTDLSQKQRDFLIDTIMMRTSPRSTWIYELNAHRSDPNESARWNVMGRLQSLTKYMLCMAEFQLF